jgi:hypothetical protein
MPNSPVIIGLLAFSVASCVFAFVKGGGAERIGAGVIFANMVIMLVASDYFLKNPVLGLSLDALTAIVLLGLAVRYASFWLGCVMLLYALQFTLHAFYFVSERPRDRLHVMINNIDFFAISLCLMIGTAVAWRRGVKARAAG